MVRAIGYHLYYHLAKEKISIEVALRHNLSAHAAGVGSHSEKKLIDLAECLSKKERQTAFRGR